MHYCPLAVRDTRFSGSSIKVYQPPAMLPALPGADPGGSDSDPIGEASDRHTRGDHHGAEKRLVEMLAADLRCLDGYAHLGNFAFDHDPQKAVRHDEVGVRISRARVCAESPGGAERSR